MKKKQVKTVAVAAKEEPVPGKKKKKPEDRGFVAEWAVTILMLLFGTTTLLQAFVVPTGSMENTVLIGDHMFVDKLAYAPAGALSKHLLPYTEVKRGDVIVFRWPVDLRQNYIKRVVGVPGDHLKLVNKDLYLNGKKMEEPYVVHLPTYSPYRDEFPTVDRDPNQAPQAREMFSHIKDGELVIPPGQYFAMGDNRDNSLDSRYWGFVPRENIIGKPSIIFWSYATSTERLADPNLISLDHIIDLVTNFIPKTRWSRTFKLIRGYPLGA
jgi:signal peptidase I